ncbi:hypothetical protein ACFB49_26000 [Sphingomonas sp. DBB INV C78]|uniref:enoyl-CoA hydratase-related protein n=1 Tax=Sphingomonas sp. DBB INV C78 TaxID=3349434 RepID=UPI0036D318E1
MVSDRTPVLVGAGQAVDRIGSADYRGYSPVEIAAAAAKAALADCGAARLIGEIDLVGGIRTFEDATSAPSVFGKPDKFPLAVAKRLGLSPTAAILEKTGGQSPVALLGELADRIARGQADVALAFGGEALSTVRQLKSTGETPDWSERIDGEMEDKGRGLEGLVTRQGVDHGLRSAPAGYGLIENARRARLGLSIEEYRREMGELFRPFSEVAAANPYSSADGPALSVEQLITPGERNRMIADPYPLRLVARDQVNQGAAVLVMSVAKARELGVPESRWVFIHGFALAQERDLLEREDLGGSVAIGAALQAALDIAGKSPADMRYFDFYSCFPIAVFAAAIDGLGLARDDPRRLTVTGGLPYFGGPGNNYSMHAVATMMELLRASPGDFGLVGANGGYLTKYGAMILSIEPCEWRPAARAAAQIALDRRPAPRIAKMPDGKGHILTYTVQYDKGMPALGLVIGELRTGERFLANPADPATLAEMSRNDPIGREIAVCHRPEGNRFAFDEQVLDAAFSVDPAGFRDNYETVIVNRRDHILEVTIDRPEQRNSISQTAHDELNEIFDAFEADRDLWVAIITGAGEKAFCAGADLKGAANGRTIFPLAGFAGITSRRWTKPLIAAINGAAFGGGLEIALAAHLVVTDPAARFALSEVRVGVVPGAGGAIRLQRQIPRKIAMELLLTGRSMDVAEARSLGFINRVSAPGQVLEEARALAREITAVSPTSVRVLLQLIAEGDRCADADDAAAPMLHSSALDALLASEDMIEGMTAFAQKRPPNWKNR